jgi:hypothetical protein
MAVEQAVSEGYKAVELVVASGIGGVLGTLITFLVSWKLQTQKHEHNKRIIEYTSLHDKQAEIIADFYAQLSGLYGSIEQLMGKYQMREMKEEIEREHPYIPKSKQIGLTEEEQKAVDAVKICDKELFEFYRKKKIYLSLAVCELTNRFCNLASYLAMNYHNVTFKELRINKLSNY